jgi:3-phenylpropionate/cinnamic acid dioxygenase small subunit
VSEQDVRRLLVRYCELMDAADWDGIGELFRRGVLADETGSIFARGAAEVASYFREHIRLYDGSPGTKHLVLNTILDNTKEDVIVANSSYLVLQSLDDSPLQPIVTGRYRDTFSRDPTWRFTERRYSIDLAGDLSRHLKR